VSRPCRFTPGESTLSTHWLGGWMYPRASLDNVEKRKFLTLLGLKLWPLGHPACSQSLYQLRYPGSWGWQNIARRGDLHALSHYFQLPCLCVNILNKLFTYSAFLFVYMSEFVRPVLHHTLLNLVITGACFELCNSSLCNLLQSCVAQCLLGLKYFSCHIVLGHL
jgi:hypothetical protein